MALTICLEEAIIEASKPKGGVRMRNHESVYLCIDLKSFYASVECIARGLNPLQARLLVADAARSDQTICLAVSPALKAIGVPSRPGSLRQSRRFANMSV